MHINRLVIPYAHRWHELGSSSWIQPAWATLAPGRPLLKHRHQHVGLMQGAAFKPYSSTLRMLHDSWCLQTHVFDVFTLVYEPHLHVHGSSSHVLISSPGLDVCGIYHKVVRSGSPQDGGGISYYPQHEMPQFECYFECAPIACQSKGVGQQNTPAMARSTFTLLRRPVLSLSGTG